MGSGRRNGVGALSAALIVIGFLGLPSGALANHHFIKISEVHAGNINLSQTGSFIELQMHRDGQNQVGGHKIAIYNNLGMLQPNSPITIPGNVAIGESQRTILVADNQYALENPGVARDFTTNSLQVDYVGGAACFESSTLGPIDCVSWGDFLAGSPRLGVGLRRGDFPGGSQPNFPGEIPPGQSLHRSTTPSCPTLLEEVDDTDSSAADFTSGPPSPRANAASPTERLCAEVDVKKSGQLRKLKSFSRYMRVKVESTPGTSVKVIAKKARFHYYYFSETRKKKVKFRTRTSTLTAGNRKTLNVRLSKRKYRKYAKRAYSRFYRRGYLRVRLVAIFTDPVGDSTRRLVSKHKLK